jgi:hypothetical protein
MGAESFPEVKRPGHGINHPPAFSTQVIERAELYLYFPTNPAWQVTG